MHKTKRKHSTRNFLSSEKQNGLITELNAVEICTDLYF